MTRFITILLVTTTLSVTAQETSTRSVFRNGYQRLGLNFLGGKLDNRLSAKTNVFNGNFGAKTGYCVEFGRNFYFNKNSKGPFRFV